MPTVRVIPCLLLRGRGLVKTIRFGNPTYVGDPINAVKIFNDKEVDELLFLDITASLDNRTPDKKLMSEIASECFMPLAYGGGVRSLDDIRELFALGVEKVAINSHAMSNPEFVKAAAEAFGSQSILVSIDVKRNFLGRYEVWSRSGRYKTGQDPVTVARLMEAMGAGEILLNSIDRDGMMQGYDVDLIRQIAKAVQIPVVACGGAGNLEHFTEAVRAGASAVSAGSMFVFHGRHRAVLISYPSRDQLDRIPSLELIHAENS